MSRAPPANGWARPRGLVVQNAQLGRRRRCPADVRRSPRLTCLPCRPQLRICQAMHQKDAPPANGRGEHARLSLICFQGLEPFSRHGLRIRRSMQYGTLNGVRPRPSAMRHFSRSVSEPSAKKPRPYQSEKTSSTVSGRVLAHLGEKVARQGPRHDSTRPSVTSCLPSFPRSGGPGGRAKGCKNHGASRERPILRLGGCNPLDWGAEEWPEWLKAAGS